MVDNYPSARAKPEGEGVDINHKTHGYRAVSITYPTGMVRLAALHAMATMLYYISYLIGPTSDMACF